MDIDRTTTALLTGLFDPRNAAAWEAFDRRYRPILIGFARNCGAKDVDAAEVAQETIVRFVEEYRAGKYDRNRGRLGAWLVTIARYRLLDSRRRAGTARIERAESAMVDLDDRGLVDAPWEPWQNDALTPAEEVAIDDVVRRLRRTEATLVNEATIWSRVIYPLLVLAERDGVQAWSPSRVL